jgi:hypothetical protein
MLAREATTRPMPPMLLGVFSPLYTNYTNMLYLVSCGILCHCGNVSNDTCYANLHFCDEMCSWMIAIWMKIHLRSDMDCNIVNL